MVDTQLLEDTITNSGLKKSSLADSLGISIQTLRRKSKNDFPFTTDEVAVLCDKLHITKLSDKERIFFAKNVDKTST